jgi:hypothetical protein
MNNPIEPWMFDGPDALDDGIIGVVIALRKGGIDTFSSCDGHGKERPHVWFNGDDNEGFRAESIATSAGYQVFEIKRFWYSRQGERFGPYWEISFVPGASNRGPWYGKETNVLKTPYISAEPGTPLDWNVMITSGFVTPKTEADRAEAEQIATQLNLCMK